MQQEYKSGFVTLIGRSNVGKSTLVNAMVGEKVAIVSDRPQTTRNQIRGVLHRPDYQIVFIDTPGLHRPHNRLGQFMVRSAGAALEDVDVVLAVMDASVPVGGGDRAVMDRLATLKRTPVILVLNKIDLVPKTSLLKTMDLRRRQRQMCIRDRPWTCSGNTSLSRKSYRFPPAPSRASTFWSN